MAKSKNDGASIACGCIVVGFIGISILAAAPSWLQLIIVITVVAAIVLRPYFAKQRGRLRREQFQAAVQPHVAALADQRSKLRYTGAYGELRDDKWIRDRTYFLERVIEAPIDRSDLVQNQAWANLLEAEIDAYLVAVESPFANAVQSGADLVSELHQHLQPHVPKLAWQRQRLRRSGVYGEQIDDKWVPERSYFIERVLVLPDHLARHFDNTRLVAEVEQAIDALPAVDRESGDELPGMDEGDQLWLAFETNCADIATAAGWQTSLTRASGDQGADVIAHKGNRVMVLQCKCVASAVGNKAVQEVIAARSHYQATNAVVVTNSVFTRSAIDLSESSNVHLCHIDDFPALAKAIAEWSGPGLDPPVGNVRMQHR